MSKQIVVIAGPSGSGKDTIIREILKRCSNTTRMVTAITRPPRPGETDGIDYHFMSNERFLEELKNDNILEYYHRAETNTYYGTYKPDIEERIKSGKIVLCQLQIVGAKFFKERYNATTIFIMPPSPEAFEHRIRARSPMSDIEWQERAKITKEEVEKDAPWYDYRVTNEDGKIDKVVNEVIEILHKEGYTLES